MRRDAGQLDAGVLEDLLQPLDRAAALIDLRLAQPRQVTQPADLGRRHEAGAHQPELDELAAPAESITSLVRPGTLWKCWALISQHLNRRSSTEKTGFQ